MNVGLHPTVRCHFDAAENILRVILMEKVTTDGNDSKEDIVVYALKVGRAFLRQMSWCSRVASHTQPGRAQKADFQSFAKTLCDHDELKSSAGTSPTTLASGVAAAS